MPFRTDNTSIARTWRKVEYKYDIYYIIRMSDNEVEIFNDIMRDGIISHGIPVLNLEQFTRIALAFELKVFEEVNDL